MDTARLTTLLNATAPVAVTFSMGLQVELAEVLASARPARRIGLGLLGDD